MTIENVNTTLKEYLFNELNKPSDTVLDFSFKLPNKKWMSSMGSSDNWVNIYLLDVHENLELRRSEWKRHYEDGALKLKKPPFYVDLFYLITFYNKDKKSELEHEYLQLVLLALSDFSNLSKSPFIKQMQTELFPKPYVDEQLGLQLWSALDQDARPFIPLKVTIPLESKVFKNEEIVRSKEITYKSFDGVSEEN